MQRGTSFLRLVQGLMIVAEYEKKYTQLSKYAYTIVVDEVDRCKIFEEGLRRDIRTLLTASVDWTKFSKLVEAAIRVEKSLAKEKQENETFKSEHTTQPSGESQDRSNRADNRRFVPGMSGKGRFKPRFSG